MHTESVEPWSHHHVFLGNDHARNEWRTWIVVALTAATMVGEIVAGLAFGSMALLADGFHMATHAAALSIAGLAYWYARRHARDDRFSFGTGKLGELAGFSSAIVLALVALLIGFESLLRFAEPVPIRFGEAIAVAVVGLVVNLVSAWILHAGGGHGHDHHHGHAHAVSHDHGDHRDGQRASESHADGHMHHDHNLRAAYLHVLTDALTSVLAIVALLAGRFYGWIWMDPLMGIVGSIVIARWSWGLLKGAAAVLLDMTPHQAISRDVRMALEQNGDCIADLHVWRIGPGHVAAIISIVTDKPQEPERYKDKLNWISGLSHVTVEVQRCEAHQHEAA
ncbi:CDF family Co(II)/Ni(II) efflux transporter DmeF [Amorphus sp. 3PC139-8]|uniref:CDF family Co(II)/Ni(II) efflux transporter DmeF n=1 Tax=Amorphus sp. 3PC139-8 TaxID=2735676 RepID=UPI00345C944B